MLGNISTLLNWHLGSQILVYVLFIYSRLSVGKCQNGRQRQGELQAVRMEQVWMIYDICCKLDNYGKK
jgi:hypothetical protein